MIDIFIAIIVIDLYILYIFLLVLSLRENEDKSKQLEKIEKPLTPEEKEKWSLDYAQGHNNLRFNKNLQWNLTYYCILLFGGLIGFHELLNNKIEKIPDWLMYTLTITALLIFDVGIYLTTDLQFQIRKERIGLYRYNYSFWYRCLITLVIWGTILIAFLSTVFIFFLPFLN